MGVRAERGAIELGAAALAMLTIVAGLAVGGGLYAAGVGQDDPVEVGLEAVSFSACPDGAPIGDFHRADRVLATARDESGDWLQLRDPGNLDARVWVQTAFVVLDESADAAIDDLPVDGCEETGEVVAASTTTTSTTAPTTDGTTPRATSGTTGTTGTTSGTAPAGDTTGPSIGAATAAPNVINDSPCSQVTSSTVRVSVSDPSGVASVTIAWSLYSRSGQATAVLVSGQYQVSVGPFATPVGGSLTPPAYVTITITARDAANNQSQTSANTILRVQACFG